MDFRCLCIGIIGIVVKENVKFIREEDKKMVSFCFSFKNKSNNFILFYEKFVNVYVVLGCCNYLGRF